MYRMIKERRSALHRIHHVKSFTEGGIIYPELAHDIHRLLLNHYLVEHHGAAPHTSTRSQLTVEQSHLFSGLSQIISGNDTRRTTTDNSDINRQIAL